MTSANPVQRRIERSDEEQLAEAARQTASLAALAVTLLLVVVGLYLVQALHRSSAMEDCVMAGRTNCVEPIVLP